MNERLNQLLRRPRDSFDQVGKKTREVDVVHTRQGVATHLMFLGQSGAQTFCGLQAATLAISPFLMTGCKKCAKAAVKHGVARITDTDGTLIDLPGITAAIGGS